MKLPKQRTRIVATLGPASGKKDTIQSLIRSGMSVARLNMSHGCLEDHRKIIANIRAVSRDLDTPVAVLLDLKGPRIRIGNLPKPVPVAKGEKVSLGNRTGNFPLFVDFKPFLNIVRPGERVLIDDGLVELKIHRKKKDHLLCTVIVPGIVRSGKGVNLPDLKLDIPVFTDKDKTDLLFGIGEGVDYFALSFVNSAGNIQPIRRLLTRNRYPVPVIAKIERPTALSNIDQILSAFDGIMIARGDLGVEVESHKIPIIQKALIEKANRQNKIVITATQMLESMINHPRPTRAEVSDVSNAILDGSDMIMLSAETSIGRYPVQSTAMMQKISITTEKSDIHPYHLKYDKRGISLTEAIVKSASEVAEDLNVRCILLYTLSGQTALLLSKYRPACTVFGFSPSPGICRRMSAYWGITPCLIDFTGETDRMLRTGEDFLRERGFLRPGDLILSVAGVTPLVGATNMLRITRID